MKKQLLASLLTLCLIVGLFPTMALAMNQDVESGSKPSEISEPAEPVCGALEGCVGDVHDPDCPLYSESISTNDQQSLEQGEPSTQISTASKDTLNLLDDTLTSSDLSGELEGAEGSDLTWKLSDGILTISGTGAMKDYGYSGRTEVPWYNQKENITKVVFESGVTHIGSFAFYQHTNLTSFEMADSVVSFGSGAFQGCTALTAMPKLHENFQDFSTEVFIDTKISAYEVDADNSNYTAKDGILYSKDGTTLVNCPPGKTGDFNKTWLTGVTTIAPYAFRTCKNLTGSLVIPANITSIGRQAFQNCSSLTGDLTVPNTVTDLSTYYTFAGVSGMTGKLILESNITELDVGAFNGSGFTRMEWQGAVTTVGNSAFANCKFTGFALPTSLTTVGDSAFQNCENEAFGNLENLTSIGTYAFRNCTLGDITISANATVGERAFANTTVISVSYNAPTLTQNAFNGATVSETFTLSDNVTYIGNGNFSADKNDTVNATLNKVQTIEYNAFKDTDFNTDISIPFGATVGNNAFDGATLKNVSYDAEIVSVGAFKESTMDSLTLGDHTTKLDKFSFQKSKIDGEKLTLGQVNIIESYAFQEAILPKTVVVPSSASYYNNHVFSGVTGGETLLVYGSYNMVPTAFTHGSSFKTVLINANIVDNSNVKYGDNQKAHDRLNSMVIDHIIYMTNETSRINAKVPNNNGVVGVTNGGTFPEDTVFTSEKLATPTKEGSIFEGWYESSDFSGNPVTTPVNNKTYYAKWTGMENMSLQYKETKKISVSGNITLSGYQSSDPDIATVSPDGVVTAVGLGTTTISATGIYHGISTTFTATVTVTPMSITFGNGTGENPSGTVDHVYDGMAPDYFDYAAFYPATVEDGKVSIVPDSQEVALEAGKDIVFVYDDGSGSGAQDHDSLPVNVTDSEGMNVTVKLLNPNYRFVTDTNTALSETVSVTVKIHADNMDKQDLYINGEKVDMITDAFVKTYNGQGQAPVLDLTTVRSDGIDTFTVHFHPLNSNTDFEETHLTGAASDLTAEAVLEKAPKEPGQYLMIVNGLKEGTGTERGRYAYASAVFSIEKATVTIRPNDKTIYVGDALPELGADDYTVTGLAPGDSLTALPTLAYDGTPDTTKEGSYAIKASGAAVDEEHYTLKYEDGVLTISLSSGNTDPDDPGNSGNTDKTDKTDKTDSLTTSPQTGDMGNITVWTALSALSVIAAAAAFLRKKIR